MMRVAVGCATNSADEERPRRKQPFMEEVYTPQPAMDQQIKERLLASGLEPEGFALPLRNLRAEAAFYREENLPLLNEDTALSDEYYQIGGAQMVTWNGKEMPKTSGEKGLFPPDRTQRERAWRG